MGDAKRWAVTYTKHIKQKRKVYQDGFLEFHSSIHKVKLYDESEKLLETRLTEKGEVVKSGETLEFNAYLVDIGDPEGDHKPIGNVNFQGRDKKITEKAGLLHGQTCRTNSSSVDDWMPNSRKRIPPSRNLSPSQKIIREFKKTEMNKYGIPPTSPATAKASITEWQVLYTTQVTQKAKKYHDGILRLATCGSLGRQVTLYDLSRRHLDNRFLKKDEVVGTGESLAFDGHLVDIGEPEGDKKAQIDLNVQERSGNAVGRTGLLHQQKAQHNSSIGVPPKSAHSGKDVVSNCSSFIVDNIELRVPLNNPLRDARGILSSLRKPATSEGMVPNESAPVEPSHASPSSDFIHCDLQNQIPRQPGEDSDHKRRGLDERDGITTRRHHCSGDALKSKAVSLDLSLEIIKPIDSENERELQPKSSTSSSYSHSSEALKTLRPKTSAECSERSVTRPVSSADEPQFLGTLKSNFHGDSHTPTASVQHDGSNRNVKTAGSLELMSSRETSLGCGSQFLKQVKMENSPEPNAGNMETGTKLSDGAVACGLAKSIVSDSSHPGDVERGISKEHKKTIKMDECPSFDLGF